MRWFLRAAVAAPIAAYVALESGWIVTEVGRQPWVVYGVLRTADAASPVSAASVMTSLITYIAVYAVVFTAGIIFILRLMAEGPVKAAAEPIPDHRAPGTAMAAAPADAEPGEPS